MALNSKYVSFEPILDEVYGRTGYQNIDWGQLIEVIANTIRLIGVLPAFKDVVTNGLGSNPVPLEIVDYRALLPADLVSLTAARKVRLNEVADGSGGTDLKITGFSEMIESTNLFYQTPIKPQYDERIPSGTYDYVQFTQVETIALSGTSGTATVTGSGDLTSTITFNTNLTTTASDFVTAEAAAYLAKGIVVTSSGESIILTAQTSGTSFTSPTVTNATGDLDGEVTGNLATNPVQVIGPVYQRDVDYVYEYKLNNDYIYTNFETGFVELSYKGFVTDDSGYPMIPDDQRYKEAIKWTLIEHLDYKKWRVGDIPDKVYNHSAQKKAFYMASAISKANIPTIDQMEAWKNMLLRTISKTDLHSDYFRSANIGERRYTHNSK